MVTAVNPPKGDAPFALLDVAGGTGDIAFRAAQAGGAGIRATVCDINADMLEVGRERAAERGLDQPSTSSRPTPRPCRSPTAPSTPTPSRSASATCRGSTPALREAYRVLRPGGRFLPGILRRRRARARSALRLLFVQRDPGARPRRDRRCRGLSLPGRIDPPIPPAQRIRRDDPRRRASRG